MKATNTAQAAGHPDLELRFSYDHRGRRVRKEVVNTSDPSQSYDRRFLYDGWNLVAEYEPSPNQSHSIDPVAFHHWGNDLSNTPQGAGGVGGLIMSAYKNQFGYWQKYHPSYDGNGNIIAWTSSSGQLIEKRDYDPFGNPITVHRHREEANFQPSFGFSTKYEDQETGLLYYGYRYYDPVTGRWPSRDPIGEQGGYNLYGMVENNALDKIDFLGMWTKVNRAGKNLATTCAQEGDTWKSLADELYLEESEASKWVEGFDTTPISGKIYKVPNTTVVWMSKATRFFDHASIVAITKSALYKLAQSRKKAGFRVVEEYSGDNTWTFNSNWRFYGIYEMHFGGHGEVLPKTGNFYAFLSGPSKGQVSSPKTINKPLYKLSSISALHCGGWRQVDWRQFVSTNNGRYTGYLDCANIGNFASSFKTEIVK